MPGTDGAKSLAITLVDCYVRRDREALERAVAEVDDNDNGNGNGNTVAVEEVTSELKVLASFLTRRVQETGVVWKPADSREAVAAAVADLLPPEVEFAVVTAWEAHSVGEEEAAERFANGDPRVYMHMLAAFSSAIGQAVYKPAELISTLRVATGLAE